MIIGIDESGNFNLNNKNPNWFIGAHVLDIAHQEKLNNDLVIWKNKYKSLKNNKGEIKGSIINELMADDFIESVIEPQGNFFITLCGTIPSEHTKEIIEFHKNHHLKCLRDGIENCKKINNYKLASQYEQLANWYQNISDHLLLKIWILGQMLGHSFREHVIQTILDRTDLTLGTIKISIDKDFVRSKEHIYFWKDLLRSWFYSYTYRNPIPVIKEWDANHPFFMNRNKNEQKNEKEPYVDSDHIFKSNCNFCDSHLNAEVQVADILASIISKYYNGEQFNSAYNKIRKYFIPIRQNPGVIFRMVSLDEAVPDNTPDPWKTLHED